MKNSHGWRNDKSVIHKIVNCSMLIIKIEHINTSLLTKKFIKKQMKTARLFYILSLHIFFYLFISSQLTRSRRFAKTPKDSYVA